ncbi:MAG: transketolase [Spirochaetes bacterium]|nr:transketolase [Spirochaetota bacterium]
MWQEEARRVALGIRRKVFEHSIKNNGGYLSQACSSAEILSVLYVKALNIGDSIGPPIPLSFAGTPGKDNPKSFTGALYHGEKNSYYDRFIISPAQYALIVYSALIETGRMSEKALSHYNKDGSSVEMIAAEHSPGMEVTTGSLGQGLSQAAGIALGRKLKKDTGKVWVFISDGELQEGQTWEAFNLISHYKLNNLKIIIDKNRQQCDGEMDSVLKIEPITEKIKTFGLQVIDVDGHDIEQINNACTVNPINSGLVIICNTIPYRGMYYLKKYSPKLHYIKFKDDHEKNELIKEIKKDLYED